MTTRHGCIAATVAIWTFLVAVGFCLLALLRDPAWTEAQRLTWWGCYWFLVFASAVATVRAWGER